MTKEEAREAIEEAYGNSEYTDEIIKALEQEPSEDAISRKDFIAKIEDIYDGYMLDDGGCYPQNFVDLAEEMPSVQPERKTANQL